MSRRTKGVIESTMAGIRVSSVSSTTMFQGAEPPGAEAPGKRPGREKPGAARGRAQSGAAARNRRRETREVRKNEVWKNEIRRNDEWQVTEFINQLLKVFLRIVRWPIRPANAPAG